MSQTVYQEMTFGPDLSNIIPTDAAVILLGSLESDTPQSISNLPQLVTMYSLRRMHLWNCKGPQRLPKVNHQVETIDVRNNAELREIQSLPSHLQSLHLQNCPLLEQIAGIPDSLGALRNLRIIDCPLVNDQILQLLLRRAPNLETLDLSGSPYANNDLFVDVELQHLKRLELNRCPKMETLRTIPPQLRRLGFSDSRNLKEIESDLTFYPLDHIDLTFTRSLRQLPKLPTAARTLKLFGSGILSPPRSEHGDSPHSNVMGQTREHFSEIELVGGGEVKRAKVLFLGNGQAGKSHLATRLYCESTNEPFDASCRYWKYTQESTHGVQFLNLPKYLAGKAGSRQQIHLHMWDFGGQEIYHSTHRHFVRNGAVFVLVWNPLQDGKSTQDDSFGHVDSLQPPNYWLDYLRAECPYENPYIAVVCADHRTPEERKNGISDEAMRKTYLQQFLNQLDPQDAQQFVTGDRFFLIDSKHGHGQISELKDWLSEKIGDVVQAQGSQVRLYWDAAQEMLAPHLEEAYQLDPADVKSPEDHANRSRWEFDYFSDQLKRTIEAKFSIPLSLVPARYQRLGGVWDQGRLLDAIRSDDDSQAAGKAGDQPRPWRIESTLRFLTHSGWIYWSPQLDGARVIINQAWALQYVYSALNRHQVEQLRGSGGRFTLEELPQWSQWPKEMDESDRKLLLTFMESVGVCFPIQKRWYESFGKPTEYLCPTHLPPSAQSIQEFLDAHQTKGMSLKEHLIQRPENAPKIHRGAWGMILKEIAAKFGDDAEYFQDAVILNVRLRDGKNSVQSSSPGNRLLIHWRSDPSQAATTTAPVMGGTLVIVAADQVEKELIENVERLLTQHLPRHDGERPKLGEPSEGSLERGTAPKKTVFLSYTWDPVHQRPTENPADTPYYEEPVNAIEKGLAPFTGKDGPLVLLRDKTSMKPGDYITEYTKNVCAPETNLVIMVLSDKYLRSWWCMLEMKWLFDHAFDHEKKWKPSVLVLKHSSIQQGTYIYDAIGYWEALLKDESNYKYFAADRGPASFPPELDSANINWRNCLNDSKAILGKLGKTEDSIDGKRHWDPAQKDQILKWILDKLDLPPKS